MEKLNLTDGWLDHNIASAKEALEATPELVSRLRQQLKEAAELLDVMAYLTEPEFEDRQTARLWLEKFEESQK